MPNPLRRFFSREEKRAISWPFDVGPPAFSSSDVSVETALTLAPVYAAARLLADSVASLPLCLYFRDQTRVRRYTGPSLFDHPSVYGTSYDWLYQCVTSLVLHGNAYGYITGIDGYGYPIGIEWLRPELVYVEEEPKMPYSGVKYWYMGREVPRELLVHVRAFTLPGRVVGVSPIRYFAMLIGSGIEQLRYGNDWFAAGGYPPGTFKNNQRTISSEDSEKIRSRLVTSMRRRQPLVYGADWDYNPIMVPPNEAQFIESMKLNATQIAAVYGIPPERIGGERGNSLTYQTQEQEEISFLQSTLRPWLVRLERAFFPLLPERRYVKFDVDEMLRTDLRTRHEVYWMDRTMGLRNVDELREREDMEPLPDGEGETFEPLEVVIAKGMAEVNEPIDPSMNPKNKKIDPPFVTPELVPPV